MKLKKGGRGIFNGNLVLFFFVIIETSIEVYCLSIHFSTHLYIGAVLFLNKNINQNIYI